MVLVCIRSSSSATDLDKEVGKTRTVVSSTAERSHMPEEFPSLALLVAVEVSDGDKPVTILQPEVSVLSLTASLLDDKHNHLSLACCTLAHGDWQLHRGGAQGKGMQHSLGFLPRDCRDNPAQ